MKNLAIFTPLLIAAQAQETPLLIADQESCDNLQYRFQDTENQFLLN